MQLSLIQKLVLTVFFFGLAVAGFMLRLPAVFRTHDKILHASFYFLAAAFLNMLFAKRNFLLHFVFFALLYGMGVCIEYAQEYSNSFLHKIVHGRYDPEDVRWNLKGLIAFSAIWIPAAVIAALYEYFKPKTATTFHEKMAPEHAMQNIASVPDATSHAEAVDEIIVRPVAFIHNTRNVPTDDHWAEIFSTITLASHVPTEAFERISDFSHLEIIYHFNKLKQDDIVFAGRPRGNPDYPLVGIFGQRKKDRPNAIGLCTVQLLAHEGRTITVKYLDAIDGTPVLDIKPVLKDFEPSGEIQEPAWCSDLMRQYWK